VTTSYRGRGNPPTLTDMDDPQVAAPVPEPEGPSRTPAVDAMVFGCGLVLWTGVTAVGGHVLGLPPLQWAAGCAGFFALAVAVARLALGPVLMAAWWVAALAADLGWLAWARWADLTGPLPWLVLGAVAVVLLAFYPLVHASGAAAAEAARRRKAEAERMAEENRWPRLLERIGYGGGSDSPVTGTASRSPPGTGTGRCGSSRARPPGTCCCMYPPATCSPRPSPTWTTGSR